MRPPRKRGGKTSGPRTYAVELGRFNEAPAKTRGKAEATATEERAKKELQ